MKMKMQLATQQKVQKTQNKTVKPTFEEKTEEKTGPATIPTTLLMPKKIMPQLISLTLLSQIRFKTIKLLRNIPMIRLKTKFKERR